MARLRFDCVFHPVRDLERSVSFYRDQLGLQLTSRDAVARFELDGVLFELVPGQVADGPQAGTNARLCLKVKDVRRAREDLRDKGVLVSEPRRVEGGWLASFCDPDGNEIYLWQYQ